MAWGHTCDILSLAVVDITALTLRQLQKFCCLFPASLERSQCILDPLILLAMASSFKPLPCSHDGYGCDLHADTVQTSIRRPITQSTVICRARQDIPPAWDSTDLPARWPRL